MPRQANVPRVAVVVSRYNATVTDRLLDGALKAYAGAGGKPADVEVVPAPGSYELTALALEAARTGRFAGVLALGCIIKGDTPHDGHIARAVAHGLVEVTLETGVPVSFGVLTTNTAQQARARAGGGKGNKGVEAMTALLETIAAIEALRSGATSVKTPATIRPDKAGKGRRA